LGSIQLNPTEVRFDTYGNEKKKKKKKKRKTFESEAGVQRLHLSREERENIFFQKSPLGANYKLNNGDVYVTVM
jgi:IS1 family transposase